MGVRKRAVYPRPKKPAYEPHERRDNANDPWSALGRAQSSELLETVAPLGKYLIRALKKERRLVRTL